MNKVVLALIAITAISGVAVLSSNVFPIDLQSYQIFNSFDEFTDPVCTCFVDGEFSQENCQGFSNGYIDPNMLCTSVAGIQEYGDPVKEVEAQGCGVGFWKNNPGSNNLATIESENTSVWPLGYQPDYYYNDMFQTTISPAQFDDNEKIVKLAKSNDDDVKDDDDDLSEESENKDDGKLAKKIDEEMIGLNKGPTLLEALNAKGGDMNSLLRHSVAAMLNAAHSEINYPMSVGQIIELTQISLSNGDYQEAIDVFERYNEELEKPSMCLE